jgi:hypothetical protein
MLPKRAKKLRSFLNELARKIYAAQGHVTPEGSDFERSTHPQERGAYALALLAYEHFYGDLPCASQLY